MLSPSVPAKQQAHDLVDRMTPLQTSALIDLFEPLARPKAQLSRAPFCDELPIDAEEVGAFRVRSVGRSRVTQSSAA
jgi:hypothetical protein